MFFVSFILNFFLEYRNKEFLLSALLYGLYTVFTIGYEELFPVFAATSVQYGRSFYLAYTLTYTF